MVISSPRAAWLKVIGTWSHRSSPLRMNIGCGCTFMTMYRSPAGPPLLPGWPWPCRVITWSLSMPAGMFTVILTVLRTWPLPPQVGHGFSIILPVPPQCVHVRLVCIWPNMVFCTTVSMPLPPQ